MTVESRTGHVARNGNVHIAGAMLGGSVNTVAVRLNEAVVCFASVCILFRRIDFAPSRQATFPTNGGRGGRIVIKACLERFGAFVAYRGMTRTAIVPVFGDPTGARV